MRKVSVLDPNLSKVIWSHEFSMNSFIITWYPGGSVGRVQNGTAVGLQLYYDMAVDFTGQRVGGAGYITVVGNVSFAVQFIQLWKQVSSILFCRSVPDINASISLPRLNDTRLEYLASSSIVPETCGRTTVSRIHNDWFTHTQQICLRVNDQCSFTVGHMQNDLIIGHIC